MAWLFDRSRKLLIDGRVYDFPLMSNLEDIPIIDRFATETLFINGEKLFQPYSLNSTDNFTYGRLITLGDNYTKVFPKEFRCLVQIKYEANLYVKTTDFYNYQFKIKRISLEYPLPVKTTGSYSIPANVKSQSGDYLAYFINQGGKTYKFTLWATYNNESITNSVLLDADKTYASFYLS